MTETTNIVLGGNTFTVTTPLMLDQLIKLRVGVAAPILEDAQENTRQTYERTKAIIVAGLGGDHPEIDAKSLGAMRISESELFAAASAILEISGLTPRKAPEPGEASAEVA